jgi:hypothetical protein
VCVLVPPFVLLHSNRVSSLARNTSLLRRKVALLAAHSSQSDLQNLQKMAKTHMSCKRRSRRWKGIKLDGI